MKGFVITNPQVLERVPDENKDQVLDQVPDPKESF